MKQYDVKGIICKPSEMNMLPNVPFFVTVTKDIKGCTV